jgi:hypothetical protein
MKRATLIPGLNMPESLYLNEVVAVSQLFIVTSRVFWPLSQVKDMISVHMSGRVTLLISRRGRPGPEISIADDDAVETVIKKMDNRKVMDIIFVMADSLDI